MNTCAIEGLQLSLRWFLINSYIFKSYIKEATTLFHWKSDNLPPISTTALRGPWWSAGFPFWVPTAVSWVVTGRLHSNTLILNQYLVLSIPGMGLYFQFYMKSVRTLYNLIGWPSQQMCFTSLCLPTVYLH